MVESNSVVMITRPCYIIRYATVAVCIYMSMDLFERAVRCPL